MNLKSILLLSPVFILLLAACGGTQPLPEIDATVKATPTPAPTATPSSTSDQGKIATPSTMSLSQNNSNWDQRYLKSIEECLNRVLGTQQTEQILTENRELSSEEAIAITDCSKPRGEGQSSGDNGSSSSGADRAADGKDRDAALGGDPSRKWNISPTQIGCMFDSIGKSAYRDIFDGVRPPTATEIQTAQPCLTGSRSLNDVPHPLGAEQCPSLEILQRNLEEYQPSWDQLECHMKEDFQRLPLPSFRTSARINPIVLTPPKDAPFGCQGLLCPQGTKGVVIKDLWNGDLDVLLESMEADSWEQFAGDRYQGSELDYLTSLLFTEAEFPSANFTFLPMNMFRTKTDELGQNQPITMEDYWHDATLRAYAVHVIQRKREGHIIQMNLSWGGSKEITTAKTPEEFRNWIDEIFIPQKIHEAKIAERLKIETYKPWMTEIDVWVMYQSWALEASDQELLETGQYLLDAVVAAVRPHFKGRITPHTWQHGSAVHEGYPRPIWKELTFKGFDEVGVSYFPRCDMETTMADARVQFEAIMEMVKRDSIPWVISEMDTNSRSFEGCGTDLFDQADEIWSAVLDLISELEIQPIGISTYGFGNIYSKEHKAVLEEKVFSRSAD